MNFYNKLAEQIKWYNETKPEYKEQALDNIRELEERLPHGSGFDIGCKVDLEKSTAQKIVISTHFHHMDEHGYYDGWTEHTVTVTPCLVNGYKLKVSGVNKNNIKDYIYDMFNNVRLRRDNDAR